MFGIRSTTPPSHLRYGLQPDKLDDIRQSSDLRSTFLRFPNVRALSLSTSPMVDYTNASPDAFGYRVLLHNYLTFGELTTLTIWHISGLPILQICSCLHLSALSVDDCEMDKSLDFYKQAQKPLAFNLKSFQGLYITVNWIAVLAHPNLESIDTITSRGLGVEWWRWCLAAERNGEKAFQRVKQLVVVDLLEGSDITDITHLFNHLAELQTLEIYKNNANSKIDITSIIRAIPTECTLETLSIKWAGTHAHEMGLIDALCHTLPAIKSQNVLQDLELELTIGHISMHFSNIPFDEWRQLADVVDSHSTAFPCLHRVQFKVYLQLPANLNQPHLQTFLDNPLAHLLDAKTFEFRCDAHLCQTPPLYTSNTIYPPFRFSI